jgi:hypothetical protein
MGFIPLFLTAGGACLLFFLTVRISLLAKLNRQRTLGAQLGQAHPELGIGAEELVDPEKILGIWKAAEPKVNIAQSSLELIRELKINQYQYNRLIKKAPYNWVAAFGGFKAI